MCEVIQSLANLVYLTMLSTTLNEVSLG